MDIVTEIRTKLISIKRAIKLAKIGYNTVDWDYSSIYELLIFQLETIEKCKREGWSLNKYKDCQIILEIIEDLRMVKDERVESDLEWETRKARNTWFKLVGGIDGLNNKSIKSKKAFIKYDKLQTLKEKELNKIKRRAFRKLEANIERFWE